MPENNQSFNDFDQMLIPVDGSAAPADDFDSMLEPVGQGPTAVAMGGAAGQAGAGEMVESGSLLGGAIVGARVGMQAGAQTGVPAMTALGGIGGGLVGAFAGQEIGQQGRRVLSETNIPGTDTAFAVNSVDDLPPDLRPAGIAGEVFFGSAVPTTMTMNAALRGASFEGKTLVGKWTNSMLDTIRSSPKAFMTAEGFSAGGAAAGGAIAEELAPGEGGVRLGAEVAGGLFNPSRLLATSGRLTKQVWDRVSQTLSPASRQNEAARILQQIVTDAGEDPVMLARMLKESNLTGTNQTIAQLTGSPALAAMQKKLGEYSANFGAETGRMATEGLDAVKDMIGALHNIGDPSALREAARLKKQYFSMVLSSRLQAAEGEALSAAQQIARDTPDAVAEISTKAREAVGTALRESRKVESELWGRVPKDMQMSGDNFVETLRSLKAELPSTTKLSSVEGMGEILSFAKRVIQDKTPLTTGEMILFRSRVLELQRDALKGANAKPSVARRLGIVADSVLDDLDAKLKNVSIPSVPGGFNVAEVYDEARFFSRALNETFKRSFVGKALADSAYGQTVSPELMLRKAMSGGREAASLKMQELEDATTFLKSMNRESAESLQTFDTMIDSQERMIRIMASESIDSATGKLSQKKLSDFVRNHSELLNRFPEAKADLTKALSSAKALSDLENSVNNVNKLVSQKAAFAKVLEFEHPVDAVRNAIKSKEPIKAMSGLVRLAGKNEDSLDGLKASIYDYAVSASTTGQQGLSLSKFSKVMFDPIREGQPSLAELMVKTGAMDAGDLDRSKKLLLEAARIESTFRPGMAVDDINSPYDMMVDLMSRVTGAVGATKLFGGSAQGHGILVAGAGSRFGQSVFKKVPAEKVREVLMRATIDKDLAKLLLTQPTNQAQRIKLGAQMHSYLITSGMISLKDSTEDDQ